LVAALPVVDVQEVSVWLSPDESGWLVSKRPAFQAGLYWAKFRTQAEADSFRSLLAYRAALAAQDAGGEGMIRTIFNRAYDWNSLSDLERDVMEAVEDSGLPGEYTGEIRVVMTYVPPTEGGDGE
jgi:hypothetical protein